MSRARIIGLVVSWVVAVMAAAGYVVPESVLAEFEGRRLTPIEGVWVWSSGATVAIVADERGNITMTLLDSPDPIVEVPQVMGAGSFAGKQNSYNVRLSSSIDNATGRFKSKKQQCILTIADGMLLIAPYSTGYRVNLWRLVPYLFRFSVTKDKAPDGAEGAVRVYPIRANPLIPPVL